MKHLLLLLFLCLLWMGCRNRGPKVFDYDEVIHYYNPITIDELAESAENARSRLDTLKSEFITGGIPDSIADTGFIADLWPMGYTQKALDKSLFSKVDDIFSEKKVSEAIFTSCLPVYRDILVFKKQNKITGIAKVCFECGHYQIEGAKGNTFNFGQDGDYARLYRLLHDKELL